MSSNTVMTIKSSQLGKNLNKQLIKAYNNGYKILVINNYLQKDTKYNIVKEIQKRKLIMIIDIGKMYQKMVKILLIIC